MARDFPNSTSVFLDTGDVSGVDITGTALTLCAWVRPDSVSGTNRQLVVKGSSTLTSRQYGIAIGSGSDPQIYVGDSGGRDIVQGSTSAVVSVWQHICGRKNGTGAGALEIFLNGVSGGTATSNRTIQNTAHGLRFSGFSDSVGPFDGLMAEVGLWNVALNNAEIAALAEGVSPLLIRPQNLRGYWPLSGTGSPEPDYSGLGSHATINGSLSAGNNPPVRPFQPISLAYPSQPSLPIFLDEAQIYIDLQPSGADVAETVDQQTIYVDLLAFGVDIREQYDAATVYVDLSNLGGECYSTYSGVLLGEGEANLRWMSALDQLRWSGDPVLRWSTGDISVEGVHC